MGRHRASSNLTILPCRGRDGQIDSDRDGGVGGHAQRDDERPRRRCLRGRSGVQGEDQTGLSAYVQSTVPVPAITVPMLVPVDMFQHKV